MKRKVPLWMFGLSIVFAVAGFALWGKSNLNYIDHSYGLHAQEYYSKAKILELLNLDQVEGIGLAVAVCLMNKC